MHLGEGAAAFHSSRSVMGGRAGEDLETGQPVGNDLQGKGLDKDFGKDLEKDIGQDLEKDLDKDMKEKTQVAMEEANQVNGEEGKDNDSPEEDRLGDGAEKGKEDDRSSDMPAYKEGYVDIVGRVLLATRALKVGEVVVEDTALVAAPDGAPVCLGCLGPLTLATPVMCVNCGWPLCR